MFLVCKHLYMNLYIYTISLLSTLARVLERDQEDDKACLRHLLDELKEIREILQCV